MNTKLYTIKENKKGTCCFLLTISMLLILFEAFLFTSCTKAENSNEPIETPQIIIQNLFLDLCNINTNPGNTTDDIQSYIKNHLDNIKIPYKTDGEGNIFASRSPDKKEDDAKTTTLVSYMRENIIWRNDYIKDKSKVFPLVDDSNDSISSEYSGLGATSKLSIATTLYVLSNAADPSYINAIFINGTNTDQALADKISSYYLQTDTLIGFDGYSSKKIYNSSKSTSAYNNSHNFSKIDAHLKNAYIINADRFLGGQAGLVLEDERGNPIEFICQLLVALKTDGIAYEISGLVTNGENGKIPTSGNVILSVGDYEAKKLNSTFKKVSKEYKKQHEKSEPYLSLTIAQTIPPSKTLSADDTSKITTFLYTLPLGNYSDDEIGAYIELGSIDLADTSLSIEVLTGARDESTANEIYDAVKKVSALSNFSINLSAQDLGYFTNQKLNLPKAMDSAFREKTNIEPAFSDLPTYSIIAALAKKNQNISPLILGFDISYPASAYEVVSTKTIADPAIALLGLLEK